ncbi:lysophospholipase L1-like esterase [Duganella sp. SG902]|uniref:SGNH/GDSL hydrolase family protein n=1 Tax=Duganella sp. SG902 TaxID=2587016 RepID=UPI00159EB523|nr:SGNH/GDSL hydrolase family protein [Duganella sp. SG902]NVM76113.1 lysophospholipase L1-like esterase [Duganella sp. SG902]
MTSYIAVAALAAVFAAPLHAADNWVATWQASPHAAWGSQEFALPTGVPAALEHQTVRETARISVGGRRVRVVLSNRYGTQPITIGEARVARIPAAAKAEGAGMALTFGGQRRTVIPAGAPLVSDPLEMPVTALEKLAVSVYLPRRTPLSTFHWGAQQTGYIARGNHASAATLPDAEPLHGRALLSGIWVDGAPSTGAVVAFGDSITDGNGSMPDADRRWPDYLAARMPGTAVVNAGISGARLLGDRMGVNAAARFELDVLSQPGAHTVIILMGINDIGWPQSIFAPHEPPMSADRMIAAYRQLIAQARARKMRIIGATLPPFEGTQIDGYYTPAKDALRQQVNQWIRESKEFDAVADVDALLRDPERPSRMRQRYDSGDHLHPGDAGYEAIAAEAARVISRY